MMGDMIEREETIEELKKKLNTSLSELVRLILQQKRRIDSLESRLEKFNERAGHKI
jgi:hypothetical protein